MSRRGLSAARRRPRSSCLDGERQGTLTGIRQLPKNAPDPAIALTAVGAIFAALVGTSLLDMGNSEPAMRVADHVTQAIWIPLFLLFAYLTVRPESKTLPDAAWILAGIAGLVTAGVVVFTTFGFTRDTEYVLLRLDTHTRQVV